MDFAKFRADWERDEGFKPHAYLDSEGFWTIGHGILIDERRGGGITREESRYLYGNRLMICVRELERVLPGLLDSLDAPRATVIAEMALNLGVRKFLGFKLMIAALRGGEWEEAARQALDSKWARQVGERAKRIADTLRYGEVRGE